LGSYGTVGEPAGNGWLYPEVQEYTGKLDELVQWLKDCGIKNRGGGIDRSVYWIPPEARRRRAFSIFPSGGTPDLLTS
jgi:hypothetical protein